MDLTPSQGLGLFVLKSDNTSSSPITLESSTETLLGGKHPIREDQEAGPTL